MVSGALGASGNPLRSQSMLFILMFCTSISSPEGVWLQVVHESMGRTIDYPRSEENFFIRMNKATHMVTTQIWTTRLRVARPEKYLLNQPAKSGDGLESATFTDSAASSKDGKARNNITVNAHARMKGKRTRD
jgi:hypothetical protein